MADSPVNTTERRETVNGQAQARPAEPDNGQHFVHEAFAVTDRVILDANSPEAVQVPKGVGASTAGHESPLAVAYRRGTPEAQFEEAQKDDSEEEDTDEDEQVEPEATAADE